MSKKENNTSDEIDLDGQSPMPDDKPANKIPYDENDFIRIMEGLIAGGLLHDN